MFLSTISIHIVQADSVKHRENSSQQKLYEVLIFKVKLIFNSTHNNKHDSWPWGHLQISSANTHTWWVGTECIFGKPSITLCALHMYITEHEEDWTALGTVHHAG